MKYIGNSVKYNQATQYPLTKSITNTTPKTADTIARGIVNFLNRLINGGKRKTMETRAYLGIEEKVPVKVPSNSALIENTQ